jgi:hypothetical protein
VTGSSITILLTDGTPEGLRIVSKSHWTGVALVCSRTRYLDARAERPEYGAPGVYVLVGRAEDPSLEGRIYIGESEDTRRRIDDHASRDFWTRVVVFTSTNMGLNKASIKHLESRLIKLAKDADRFELENTSFPTGSALSEADLVAAEAFLEDMLMIYPLIGVRAFEPLEEASSKLRLHLSGPSAEAEGVQTEDGFLVFADARARATPVESIPPWAERQRQALLASGILAPFDDADSLILKEDHEFASPSAAAAVILGRSAAGPIEWKDSHGKTLKVLTEEKIGAGDGLVLGGAGN